MDLSLQCEWKPLEVNNDLLNDVGSLEVQGYEVHEKLYDRKEQGAPHFVTTTVDRHGSTILHNDSSRTSGGTGEQSSQHNDGSSTTSGIGDQRIQPSYGASTLGGTEELKTSVADNTDVYKTAGGAVTSGINIAGMEIIKIVNPKTNSHATPYNSVWSDSIKHSIGEDATFTHKPIIVRSLTLSEVDNGSRNKGPLIEKHYTGEHVPPGVVKISEGRSKVNSPVPLRTQSNVDADSFRNREVVRQPHYSSHGPEAETGFDESHGSPSSIADEEEATLHTTTSQNVLVDHNSSSVIQNETPVVDFQKDIKGGYSRRYENQDEFKSNKGLSNAVLSSGTQRYLDHSANGESSDRVNLFPSQPRYTIDQNIFGRYPSSDGEYLFNHNGPFPQPPSPTQLDLDSYNSRLSYTIPHQQTLHHLDHSFRSSPNKGYHPVETRDEAVFGRDIYNHNLYFPSYPENGIVAFGGIPFVRPPLSILSHPREEAELGLSRFYQ